MSGKKRTRGKPKGYRSIEGLHERIYTLLREDKKMRGVKEGRTAFYIATELSKKGEKVNNITAQKYLEDLVTQGLLAKESVGNMVLYRTKKAAITQ